MLVETLETATSWSNLEALKTAVTRALESALAAPLVMCHVSHLYATGASLYFTALAAQDASDPVGQWQAAKAAATDAIVATGGTISHHHAVGADHAPWLPDEVGALGHDVLRVVKERCDPAGVMNPGKLLAASRRRSAGCRRARPGRASWPAVALPRDHDLLEGRQPARELVEVLGARAVVPSWPSAPTGSGEAEPLRGPPGDVNQTA